MFNNANYIDYSLSYLHIFEYSIQSSIGTFKKYIEENEKLIKNFDADLKRRISNDDQLKSDDENFNASYYFNKYDLEVQLLNEFKNTHRFSVFISMFSFFEGKLNSLCEVLQEQFSPTAKVKKGNHLEYYFEFLTEVLQVDNSGWAANYRAIQNLNSLRNKLVHEEGLINEGAKEIVVKTAGLTVHHSGQLFTIDDDLQFLNDFIDNMDLVFRNLIKSVDNYHKEFKDNRQKSNETQ